MQEPGVDLAASRSISWTYSPIDYSSSKLYISFCLIGASSFAASILFHCVAAAVIVSAVLLFSIADSILPMTYSLDSDGVTVKVMNIEYLHMPRSAVKKVYWSGRTLKLTPYASPEKNPMENFRGIPLKFTVEQTDEVLDYLSSVWAKTP